METLIKRLKSTRSTNSKIDILKEYSNDKQIKNVLRLCYDPGQMSYITKIKKPKETGNLNFRKSVDIFCALFNDLTNRNITGNNAKNAVSGFLSAVTADIQDIYISILKKDLRCGIGVKTLNKAFGDDFVYEFKIQLANTYDPGKNYGVDEWIATPKLDGLRAIYIDGELRTRRGHLIVGFDHIKSELEQLCEDYNCKFIDMELYSNNIPFQTIQSIVLGEKDITAIQKQSVFANIFYTGCNYYSAYDLKDDFSSYINWQSFDYLKPVPMKTIKNNKTDIETQTFEYFNAGYEGIMLRHPIKHYDWKRSDALLKNKPVFETDFQIVGFVRGDAGKQFENTLGAIYVQGEWQGKKIQSKVGSGFIFKPKDKDGNDIPIDLNWNGGDWGPSKKPTREWIWANRDELSGRIVEIQFQGLTDKPKDGNYSLRFPVFNKLKLDR